MDLTIRAKQGGDDLNFGVSVRAFFVVAWRLHRLRIANLEETAYKILTFRLTMLR